MCRSNFLKRIYLHSNCKWECKLNANARELREKPKEEKLTGQRGGKIPLYQSEYKEFSTLYYEFHPLGFPFFFSMDLQVYKYPVAL